MGQLGEAVDACANIRPVFPTRSYSCEVTCKQCLQTGALLDATCSVQYMTSNRYLRSMGWYWTGAHEELGHVAGCHCSKVVLGALALELCTGGLKLVSLSLHWCLDVLCG